MTKRGRTFALLTVAILILAFVAFYFSPPPVGTSNRATSGLSVQVCTTYAGGATGVCNTGKSSPFTSTPQAVLDSSGNPIASVQITRGTLSFKYNGSLSSWSFSAPGQISYGSAYPPGAFIASAKGSGVSGCSTNCVVNASIGFSISSWSATQLQQVWGANYGTQNVTLSLAGFTLTPQFASGAQIPPIQRGYFKIASLGLSYPQGNSITGISINGGKTSSSSWTTTANAATGGANGNQAANGVICTLAPDATGLPQASVWCYIPQSIGTCSCSVFMTLMTSTTSTTETLPFAQGWVSALFSGAVGQSDTDIIILSLSNNPNSKLFNQIVPVSISAPCGNGGPAVGINPPTNYCSQYQASLAPITTTTVQTTITATYTSPNGLVTTTTGALYNTYTTTTVGSNGAYTYFATQSLASNQPLCWGGASGNIPIYSQRQCNLLSVIYVIF